MFSSLTKTFPAFKVVDVDSNLVKEDPITGLSEFPPPGDLRKQLLPLFIENDDDSVSEDLNPAEIIVRLEDIPSDETPRNFWMPDKLCKVCYGCEDPFTMYRRRHHCRMCGQIFCNVCSSYYIDGALINLQGLVRCCRLCSDQLSERTERESKLHRRRMLEENGILGIDAQVQKEAPKKTTKSTKKKVELPDNIEYNVNLQNMASAHLESIVRNMVQKSTAIEDSSLWIGIILHLVREVVSSIDPNVRRGDGMDVRQFVKLKIIPGGSVNENAYIDGIVFRKNVSHKKMAIENYKAVPRILLLTGGIEFQRTDNRLSSMDTLIEQEDKYMEILVEKIMSLKPDIVLVGKSVARTAQELLCSHKVVVMQNVKPQLLERIARLTGAMMLPSTDHMIQQYGEECLGTCGSFWLNHIQDNPERIQEVTKHSVLRTRVSRGSTYAYLQGCPSELGCSLILRGADRKTLSEVKRIIGFCIVVAYHLRLEVAYYNDRCIHIPMDVDAVTNYDSDGEDTSDKNQQDLKNNFYADINNMNVVSTEKSKLCSVVDNILGRSNRYLLSTSLKVDIGFPYRRELRGRKTQSSVSTVLSKTSPEDHQSIFFTSLMMADGMTQKGCTPKGIQYYSQSDYALGQFLMDTCFSMLKNNSKDTQGALLDHTLSFIHRPGRLDISVHKIDGTTTNDDSNTSNRDPYQLPIYMFSYCRECDKRVTPEVMISDETWKMSFGKFLEITFYNRCNRSRSKECCHSARDSHILYFHCEGYSAKFDFTPIHPFAIHVRESMEFPHEVHCIETKKFLSQTPAQFEQLIENFTRTIIQAKREVKDTLISRSEDQDFALGLLKKIEEEMAETLHNFLKNVKIAENLLQSKGNVEELTLKYPNILKKNGFAMAESWNSRIYGIYRHIDDVKAATLQQQQMGTTSLLPSLTALQLTSRSTHVEADDEADAEDDYYEDQPIPTTKPRNNASSPTPTSIEENKETVDVLPDSAKQVRFSETFNASTSTLKSYLDTDKKAVEKAKANRLAKALSRFVMGKDMTDETVRSKGIVPLGIFGEGRLGLPPGRNGEVIAVHEDELATAIAYSLASQEYYDQLQNVLRDDQDGVDFDFSHDTPPAPKGESDETNERKGTPVPKRINDDSDDRPRSANRIGGEDESSGSRILDSLNANISSILGSISSSTAKQGDSQTPYNEQKEKAHSSSSKPSTTDLHHIQTLRSKMMSQKKSHVRHRFEDKDWKGKSICKFMCESHWAVQFEAVRSAFLKEDSNEGFIRSLAMSSKWVAQGGKSGATFSKSLDGRFIVKVISRVELQMFLEFAPAYFGMKKIYNK